MSAKKDLRYLRDDFAARGDTETADALASLLTFVSETAALPTEGESRASEDAIAILNDVIVRARHCWFVEVL
jgi:hypothetical protein